MPVIIAAYFYLAVLKAGISLKSCVTPGRKKLHTHYSISLRPIQHINRKVYIDWLIANTRLLEL